VLGCTEIPLALAAGPALATPVCDTLDALARAAIRWAGREVAAQASSATDHDR
jgi:aspartate racemase